jgi:hypothetical protein
MNPTFAKAKEFASLPQVVVGLVSSRPMDFVFHSLPSCLRNSYTSLPQVWNLFSVWTSALFIMVIPRRNFRHGAVAQIFHLLFIFPDLNSMYIPCTHPQRCYYLYKTSPASILHPHQSGSLAFGLRPFFSWKFSDTGASKHSQCSSIHTPGLSFGRGSCLHSDEVYTVRNDSWLGLLFQPPTIYSLRVLGRGGKFVLTRCPNLAGPGTESNSNAAF